MFSSSFSQPDWSTTSVSLLVFVFIYKTFSVFTILRSVFKM